MPWVIFVIVSVIAIAVVIGRERTRRPERKQGRHRCAFCGTGIKQTADRMHYESTCRKCGRTQPWWTKAHQPQPPTVA